MKFLAWVCVVSLVGVGSAYGQQNDGEPGVGVLSGDDMTQVLQALDRERRDIRRFTGLSTVASLGAVGLHSADYATRSEGMLTLIALGLMAGDIEMANRAIDAARTYVNLTRLIDPALDTQPLSRSARTVRTSFFLLGAGVGAAVGSLIVAAFPLFFSIVDSENREQLQRTGENILIGGAVAGGSMIAVSFSVRIGGVTAMRRRVRSLHEDVYAAVDRGGGDGES